MLPAVGWISRLMHRTSVDLPEPDSPMTTKTSPERTANETPATATTLPVLFRMSSRLWPSSSCAKAGPGSPPKILTRLSTRTFSASTMWGAQSSRLAREYKRFEDCDTDAMRGVLEYLTA